MAGVCVQVRRRRRRTGVFKSLSARASRVRSLFERESSGASAGARAQIKCAMSARAAQSDDCSVTG